MLVCIILHAYIVTHMCDMLCIFCRLCFIRSDTLFSPVARGHDVSAAFHSLWHQARQLQRSARIVLYLRSGFMCWYCSASALNGSDVNEQHYSARRCLVSGSQWWSTLGFFKDRHRKLPCFFWYGSGRGVFCFTNSLIMICLLWNVKVPTTTERDRHRRNKRGQEGRKTKRLLVYCCTGNNERMEVIT